ncbi:fungal-specific transcription factor domain-containing protein [Podospora didyma]|uniref:Fungal-specific transcription factor domain-containing protein n=1 Tax=Podospora didyma TaxID=330526 RepID=A0AAE0NZK5_9PEZI|nr:fungal-specific transcription factor domain-containing protein [Podospora didyma]
MASELSFDRPPSPLQRHPLPESSVMKLTRGHSCVLCQQRKVRCDKQKPCANCVKAQVECRVVPPQPPRRRKKKPHERDLIDRLRKYETLLSQHGVNFDPIAHDLKALDHGDDVADLEQDLSGLKTSPSSAADHVTPEGGNDKHKWYPYYKDVSQTLRPHAIQFRATDEMLHDSSDEDYEGPTLHHAYDTMFENNDGFPFVVGGTQASVTNAHPSAIQVFQLWQIYINNVNPLLKLSHISTLQAQIISASANPGKIAKPLEALMFAIYFSAITSMTEEEAQSTFGEDRAILLNKFHAATQQALVNAGFMRSTELMVLQALFLYLLCARPYVDPRSLFCLIGIAVRIATRIGIHRDGALFNLPPFETEQRRRLWWQIVIFDKRIAEITGSSITALSTSQGDCRFPLNINDADLNIHAKDPPTPYHGPTEMLFCLTRVELTVAAAPNGSQQAATPGGSVNPHKQTRVHYSPSPSSPDIVTHVAQQNLPHNLVTFCQYIEDVYLKQCDSKIPLHLFTLLMTQQALSKLRVVDFLCRGVATDSVEPAERDALFTEAIRMVELDNALQTDATLQGFRWYTYQHFPLPAYIFLVSELRQRPTGELSERAWNVMVENCEHRGFTKHMRSPMHILLGHFFVKAWDTREAAEAQLGRQLMAPKIVTLLRSNMSRYKKPNSAPSSSSGGVSGPSQMPPSAGLSGGGGVPVQPDSIPGGGGLYSANKPMPDAPPPPPPPPQHMGSTNNSTSMMMDDNMVYSGFDGVSQIINNAPMGEVDFNQMDWNYLVQYGSFGGFNPNIYHPPPLGQHGGPQ